MSQEHTHTDDTLVELYAQLCARLYAGLGSSGAGDAAPRIEASLAEKCRAGLERFAEAPRLPHICRHSRSLVQRVDTPGHTVTFGTRESA